MLGYFNKLVLILLSKEKDLDIKNKKVSLALKKISVVTKTRENTLQIFITSTLEL